MPRVLVTPPTAEPVTLSEAKANLRVTSSDDDSMISAMITDARDWAENFTQRAIMTQTWDYMIDTFTDDIELPLPPLQSVTSVKYIDADGIEQTLASTEYAVDTAADRGVVRLAYNKTWPVTRTQANAVTIRFVAGYSATNPLPGAIKRACLLIINELYARRENAIVGAPITTVPVNAEYTLWPYRSLRF